jgi:hypothetical protein
MREKISAGYILRVAIHPFDFIRSISDVSSGMAQFDCDPGVGFGRG